MEDGEDEEDREDEEDGEDGEDAGDLSDEGGVAGKLISDFFRVGQPMSHPGE
jgi:hypothetical protein